ncbi:MAG: S46 family peptidase [Bacteroidales bacterium]|nr:S46 family peptidase [Bacteroidales bacterium]
MKKIVSMALAALLLSFSAFADEGMWLLPLLQKMNGKAMASLGCRLTPEQIYSVNNSSIKDAIVQFGGGCTGEIISDEGLLVTNHHCGYGSIQSLSTPEHNYLEDGFWAMNRSEEMPVPGLTVKFLQRMDDVTKVIEKTIKDASKKTKDEEEVKKAVAEAVKALEKKAVEDYPHCTARVTPFYDENVYYLIIYKTYRDVRFVGAPPASMGKFGGETDNWMWPRHTCDFSMFRVYAGADNEPADYSPENLPLRPKQSLKISLRGLEDGDFAMIMGYPGRTQRFQTAAQLKEMLRTQDISIAARTVRQDLMWEARMADPVVNLQYANKYAGSANGWKKWIGMKQAFEKLDIIGREEQFEADFMNWVNARKSRQEKYGDALEKIEKSVEESAPSIEALTLLSESIGRIEVLGFANSFLRSIAAIKTDDISYGEAMAKAVEVMGDPLYKDYNEALDRKEAAALIAFYRDNVKDEDRIPLLGQDVREMDIPAFVDALFDSTAFTSAARVKERIKTESDLSNDPAGRMCADMIRGMMKFRQNYMAGQQGLDEGARAFTAGRLEWKKGEPSYPDANSTCRLTYGTVKAYSPQDGVLYKHYTTLKGVMEKEDPDNYEFRVPAKLKEIYAAKDYGQYANAKGELPTCFLINCDITGGNSGSPVMDADGCLVGLAFDGNWESMSSDVMFEPDLQRCICVDIRYVLLLMDKFGGAGYLLDEMNLIK